MDFTVIKVGDRETDGDQNKGYKIKGEGNWLKSMLPFDGGVPYLPLLPSFQ